MGLLTGSVYLKLVGACWCFSVLLGCLDLCFVVFNVFFWLLYELCVCVGVFVSA